MGSTLKVDNLQNIAIPIVSFVEGYALGGGFELALSSDLIIASDQAKFGLPEINLGLIPGIGGTQKTKKFTFISTGMSNYKEITNALNVFNHSKICLMQCTSLYPCEDKFVGLNVLKEFSKSKLSASI